jgi:hypothetical protein
MVPGEILNCALEEEEISLEAAEGEAAELALRLAEVSDRVAKLRRTTRKMRKRVLNKAEHDIEGLDQEDRERVEAGGPLSLPVSPDEQEVAGVEELGNGMFPEPENIEFGMFQEPEVVDLGAFQQPEIVDLGAVEEPEFVELGEVLEPEIVDLGVVQEPEIVDFGAFLNDEVVGPWTWTEFGFGDVPEVSFGGDF